MAFFRGIFRTPKHSQFTYVPRYYDPQKEALRERIAEIEKEKSDDAEAMKQRISSGLRRGRGDASLRRRTVIKSNITVFVTLVVLVLLAIVAVYFYMPQLVDYIESR